MTDHDKMILAISVTFRKHYPDLIVECADTLAAAVLELVGPKPLVWQSRDTGYWASETVSGMAYIAEYRGMDQPFKLDARDYSSHMSRHPTLEAAQAAAQSHADAAHWANTALGDMMEGE